MVSQQVGQSSSNSSQEREICVVPKEAVVQMCPLKKTFLQISYRSSRPEVFSGKGALKICSKFTESRCRSVISMNLHCNFIEITLRHGFPSVNLLYSVFTERLFSRTHLCGSFCSENPQKSICQGLFFNKVAVIRDPDTRVFL